MPPEVLFWIPDRRLQVCIGDVVTAVLENLSRPIDDGGAPLALTSAIGILQDAVEHVVDALGGVVDLVLRALAAVVLAAVLGEVALVLGGPLCGCVRQTALGGRRR